jgi:hypothetical protein
MVTYAVPFDREGNEFPAQASALGRTFWPLMGPWHPRMAFGPHGHRSRDAHQRKRGLLMQCRSRFANLGYAIFFSFLIIPCHFWGPFCD